MRFFDRLTKYLRDRSAARGYTCDACGKEVFEYPAHRLCRECEDGLSFNASRACEKCGRRTLAEGLCLACKAHPPAFTKGLSPFVYIGETAGLINRLKNGSRRLAYYFGEKMTDTLLSALEQGEPVLVLPVPTTREKRRERGYNQAEALAEVVHARLQENGVCSSLDPDTLWCKEESAAQKYLTAAERRKNARRKYHLHKRKICRGKSVVLVDDIMTTGATGDACASLLLRAGAKTVYFLTAAALPERK